MDPDPGDGAEADRKGLAELRGQRTKSKEIVVGDLCLPSFYFFVSLAKGL